MEIRNGFKGLDEEERKRQEALSEVVKTEQSYYNRLTTLHEVFFQKSSIYLGRGEKVCIFQNIDELLLRSGLFLADLKKRQDEGGGLISSISDIVIFHIRKFDCFEKYCVGHEQGSLLLSQILAERSEFGKFVNSSIEDPRCQNLDLSSFLLEPVQRLARYPLLLKQILHYTKKEHVDHELLVEAVNASDTLIKRVNEAVRLFQSERRLSQLQDLIIVSSSVLENLNGEFDFSERGMVELTGMMRNRMPRQIVFEAEVVKCKSKRKLLLLLLSDMIVLLEPQNEKYSFYVNPFSLDEVTLRPFSPLNLKAKSGSVINSNCCLEIIPIQGDIVQIATTSQSDASRLLSLYERAKSMFISGQGYNIGKVEHSMSNCIGTLKVVVHNGQSIGFDENSNDAVLSFELNGQEIELLPLFKSYWGDQSFVVSMRSYDDRLRICLSKFRKYQPNETIAISDLSLDFLEYYGEKMTENYHVNIGTGLIMMDLQFKPL